MDYETVLNFHNHTTYSDGHGTYQDIANAAAEAQIEAVVITDHNIRPRGLEKYYSTPGKNILILTGEEIHDRTQNPQKNHLLVLGVEEELCRLSADPQWLVDRVKQLGGLSYLAHPFEDALKIFGEPEISWKNWGVSGYNGLEIWNAMSEFKTVTQGSVLRALLYAYFPHLMAKGAHARTLKKWDDLLLQSNFVLAIGGTDSHAIPYHLGPLKRIIMPYPFHYQTVNNHILTAKPLTGNFQVDRQALISALERGQSFVGYDLPQNTRGFRFTATGHFGQYVMGDFAENEKNLTLQIRLPHPATCHLVHNGKRVQSWRHQEICTYQATEKGYYRVECTIPFWGKQRGWIYSNPIFLGERKKS